ncbi:MAG TPA: pilus assembly protein TadG-related protein [Candidatus Limnocylindria bacterium]|nr:pilus assembly protein TadG-related protein [Candidatus Limnocylindria bacterium]
MRLWSGDERGQALILIAAALGGLLLGIGLALDTGQLFVARRAAQTAADAGAWAGAAVLYAGGSAAQARTAATDDATRNGYTSGGFISVTTASPPTTGAYSGDPGYIEVTITEQVATRFLFGASAGRTAVTVRAVAGLARSGTGQAVIVTSPVDAATFTLSGSTRFTITGGGTNTNTTNPNAVQIGVGGLLSATFHRVTGGVTPVNAGRMSPAPMTGVAAAADPFVSLAGPPASGVPAYAGQTITNATVTLSPGVYTGLVSVGNNGTARLMAGNYIFRAGLTATGSGSIVLAGAGGVLLYNANASYPAAGGACGDLSLAGTGAMTLSASRTGSYAGMLIFQDRSCTNGATLAVRTGTSLSGTLYVPEARLTISVANGVTIASQIVADLLTLTGNDTLTMNFTPASVTGTRVPSLVE